MSFDGVEAGVGEIAGDVGNIFFNYGTYHESRGRRPRDPWVLSSEYLGWLSNRFVPPDRYSRAQEHLRASGAVVLYGAPGTGCRTAALMLIHGSKAAGTGYRELSNKPDEEGEPLGSTVVEPDDSLLLDLRSTPDDTFKALQSELDSLRTKVQNTGARLVIVLSSHNEGLLSDALRPWTVGIGRPDGRRVFTRHLAAEAIDFVGADLTKPPLDRHLAQDSMREVARLAELVCAARDTKQGAGFSTWLDAALSAMTEQGTAVAKQVRENPQGRFRALLAATGFLERATSDAVFHAEHELHRALRLPHDETHSFERADLAERLAEIGASVDNEHRVKFTKLAYDVAVRDHFWRNFPGLRDKVRDWVGNAARLPLLSGEDRERLVDRFAEQCLATGQHRYLIGLARYWTKEIPVLTAARQALICGLKDSSVGWQFRQQIYLWSRDRTLRPELAEVLVTVCAEEIASTHPEQALVRLHNLTRTNDESAARSAKDALLLLASQDRRFFRRLLHRIAGNADDHALFLELADPQRLAEPRAQTRPLISDRVVLDSLTEGWASALATQARHHLADRVAGWLEGGEALWRVLVDACESRAELLNTLYLITRNWVRTAVDEDELTRRQHIAEQLNRAIDSALGLTTEENST